MVYYGLTFKRSLRICVFLSICCIINITNCIRKLSTVPVDIPAFPGVKTSWTSELNFISSDSYNPIPIYRVLDYNGNITSPAEDPKLSQEFIEKVYKNMILLNSMEQILYECQRQGRISFYMTSFGEEAVAIGSAAGLQPQDLVYPQYREAGFFLWRGYSVDEFINQCFGNCEDEGKGRMMPIHYGSKRYNIVTISSPLTVQLPQAVGAAYSFKLAKIDRCAVTYFGEGAASEGDAHAAFNFAATLQCPVLFVCRNNGYAISTPSSEQYKGDGIAGHGPAYGIHTVRVDGNDIFAVYNATKAARDFMIKEKKPVLLEALTYRIGHHSTSDDSTRYRSVSEINQWKGAIHPVSRLRQYMFNKGWWNEEMEKSWKDNALAQVKKSLERSEKLPKPHWKEMFIDVYDNMPDHIIDQMKSLEDHLKVYGEHYPKDYTGKTTV